MKRTLAIWALTAAELMAQSTMTGSKTMQGSWDASGASATKPAKSGATLPATCNIGEFFFNTAAAAGQNLYLCASANTWTQVASGGGGGGSTTVGGDLSGTTGAATVQAIQGRSLSATAPSSGQVLTWNGSLWLPQTPTGGGGGGASVPEAAVFDGSTTSLSDGSTVSWSACSTNAMCASWTVPSGISWVLVDAWAGGGPGLGAGGGSGGAGGAGGGYGHRICPVTPGGTVTVQVGLGGISGTGFGASVTQGGDSSFGTCIGATASVILNGYAYGNPPGVMKVNSQIAPPGPWLAGNGYWTILTGVSGGVGSPSLAQTAGYDAVREDQGGWPGSGWLGSTGAAAPPVLLSEVEEEAAAERLRTPPAAPLEQPFSAAQAVSEAVAPRRVLRAVYPAEAGEARRWRLAPIRPAAMGHAER